MTEMGATEAQINQHLSRFTPDDEFVVLQENWPIVEWFLQVANMLIWVGNYCARCDVTAIKDDAQLMGRKVKPAHYLGLKIMFAEYCTAINNKLAKSK
jgi:hypothetical protein